MLICVIQRLPYNSIISPFRNTKINTQVSTEEKEKAVNSEGALWKAS